MSPIDRQPQDIKATQIHGQSVGIAGWIATAGAAFIILGGPSFVFWQQTTKPKALSIAEQRVAREAMLPPLDMQDVARGKRLYDASCIACHGQDLHGVPNLGRDLAAGRFTRDSSDSALLDMINRGRGPADPGFTGPVPMPPRGGRPDFSDADLRSILSYVRAVQVPGRINNRPIPEVHVELLDGPVGEALHAATPSPAPTPTAQSSAAAALAAPPANSPAETSLVLDAEAIRRGKRVYASCIACHAKDGSGVKGMGADLTHSEFVAGSSNEKLRDFIKIGRQPGAPGSKLNLNMPPKGGNPALKDNQLDDVVIYLRSLQQSAASK